MQPMKYVLMFKKDNLVVFAGGPERSKLNPLSKHVKMYVRTTHACAHASSTGPAIAAQSPQGADVPISGNLSKSQALPKMRSPMSCSSAASLPLCGPETTCGRYWHCWSQSSKDTKILHCECTGGNLHSERAEGWLQNICLVLDRKMCDNQLMRPGAEVSEKGRAEEWGAGGLEQSRRWHSCTQISWLGLGQAGKVMRVRPGFQTSELSVLPCLIWATRSTSDLSFASFLALDAY